MILLIRVVILSTANGDFRRLGSLTTGWVSSCFHFVLKMTTGWHPIRFTFF